VADLHIAGSRLVEVDEHPRRRYQADGEYTLSGLAAGKYTVEFSSPPASELNYITRYYKDKGSFSQAEPITVAEAETISNINAELEEGGRIAGRVVAASSGTPVEGILVCAFTQSNEESGPGGCATTNANGEYTVSALPTGEYVVGFISFAMRGVEYVTQYFNGKAAPTEASPVRVTPKTTAANVDAAPRQRLVRARRRPDRSRRPAPHHHRPHTPGTRQASPCDCAAQPLAQRGQGDR
jgi:hypothetical protein